MIHILIGAVQAKVALAQHQGNCELGLGLLGCDENIISRLV
jgi:hypothetical protein